MGKLHQNKNFPGGKVRRRAELWDQMHLIFQQYNDHQLHGVLYLDGHLDLGCLKKAVLFTMRQLPELSSRYVEGRLRPYWEQIRPEADEIITCENSRSESLAVQAFLTGQIDTFSGPQLKLQIVRGEMNDTLCILMNHMICDGAGFKAYLYMLAEAYTNIRRDPAFVPVDKPGGSRSTKQVVRQIGIKDRIRALSMPDCQPSKTEQLSFPLSGEVGASPFILTYKLESVRFKKLRQYGNKVGATVNDLVLAAFIRAFCTMCNIQDGTPVTVPCVMDLRRYLPDKQADGICNLTSTILCNTVYQTGESFGETVEKVKQAMDRQKSQLPGVKGLMQLDLVFSLFPYRVAKKLIGSYFVNPLICLSNIGIIDDSKLIFDSLRVKDAFITGAIKSYPYFLLALSSFRDTVTFTVCLNGADKDRRQVEEFFILLDFELENGSKK